MINPFRNTPLYVKVFKDKLEVINLDTGYSIKRAATESFSNNRIVLADFNKAEMLLRSIIEELELPRLFFPPRLEIVIQQIENAEGGLTSIEKRALIDAAEQAGGLRVVLIDHFRPLTNDEALFELKNL